jgi:hypothetical protein
MDTDCREERDREDNGKCGTDTHYCSPMPTRNVNGKCDALVPRSYRRQNSRTLSGASLPIYLIDC